MAEHKEDTPLHIFQICHCCCHLIERLSDIPPLTFLPGYYCLNVKEHTNAIPKPNPNPYPKLISLAFSKFLYVYVVLVRGKCPRGGGRFPGENCPNPVLSPHSSIAAAVRNIEQSDSSEIS